ncbi:hypothetical protein EG329_013945 [Mollisiaceae sp. DMI_Dod_QoI]|nr:hypothetical protein EG329_013945 [Helotiales sp. DMI_Dod_QoI]
MFHSLFPSPENSPLPPPPRWIQGALILLCCASILLPAGIIRLSAGAPILGVYFYMLFWTAEQSRDAYLLGVACTILVYRWIDLVVIHRPERDFWKVDVDESGKKLEMKAPSSRSGKFKWFFNLWNTQRGVGWNIQPDCIPQALPPTHPPSPFLKTTLRQALRAYLFFDLTSNILKHTSSLFPHPIPIFNLPFPVQVCLAWITAFKLYHNIKFLYSLGACFTVLTGIYTPHDWPPIFGSFRRDAWS